MQGLKRIWLLMFIILIAAAVRAGAVGDVAQVNLILDDGVVLIYKGADYGFHQGDYLDVVRGGDVVGKLQVIEVFPTFTRTRIIEQLKTIEVFDIVGFSAPGSVVNKQEKPKEEKPKQEKPKEEKPKKEKPKKEEKPKEEKPKTEAPKKEEKKQQTFTPVAMPDSFVDLSVGYFYLNQDISSTQIEQSPATMYGIDYWMKRGKGTRMMVGFFMSNPSLRVATVDAPITVKVKFWQASLNYLFDNIGQGQGSTGYLYYGVGLAYHSMSIDDFDEDSTGTDFQGLIGYRFNKSSAFKAQYCFDENYYGISFQYGM